MKCGICHQSIGYPMHPFGECIATTDDIRMWQEFKRWQALPSNTKGQAELLWECFSTAWKSARAVDAVDPVDGVDALQTLLTRWERDLDMFRDESIRVAKRLGELAAICTRVTASPQPDVPLCPKCRSADTIWWNSQLRRCVACDAKFAPVAASMTIAEIKQAIDEKLLVYGDGLIDKGALYRDILNESRSPDGDGPSMTSLASGLCVERPAERRAPSAKDAASREALRAGSEPADSHTMFREEPSAVVESCGITEQEPEEN